MNDDPIILSEEGRRRQQKILQAAFGASRDRKRRNTVIGAARFCAVVVLMGLILWPVVYSRMSRPPAAGLSVVKHGPRTLPAPMVTQEPPVIIVKLIETDPNILQRLALPPITSTVRHIGDDELLRELADAHQAAGLISINGKARLIFR